MSMKQEIRKALESGSELELLLDIVRKYKDVGIGQREAYDEIQEIWLAYGYDSDDAEAEDPLRDRLERLLELVWGFCPAGLGVWEGSLSNQNQPT